MLSHHHLRLCYYLSQQPRLLELAQYYNVQAPEGGDAKAFLREQEERINTLVFDAVARHGGSISAEHGIGSLKAAKLPHYKSPVALRMMRAIKQALDPKGIMNPGRVLA